MGQAEVVTGKEATGVAAVEEAFVEEEVSVEDREAMAAAEAIFYNELFRPNSRGSKRISQDVQCHS